MYTVSRQNDTRLRHSDTENSEAVYVQNLESHSDVTEPIYVVVSTWPRVTIICAVCMVCVQSKSGQNVLPELP